MPATPLFSITREADDPLALRASIGSPHGLDGVYLVYRGDPMAVLGMLETVLALARVELPKQPRRPVAS